MLTLSFGFQKPQSGDPGSVWMPAIENDIQKLNDHTHDGINSANISPASITKLTTLIVNGLWVNDGGGNYSQVVSVPAQISEINNFYIKIHDTSNGNFLYPTIERVTAASFRVRVNDNTLNLTATYL